MPKMMLAELTEGMAVNTLACISQKKLLPFKNKTGNYLALTLTDRTGNLECRVFNNGEEIAARVREGAIVSITGRAETYQGNLQLNLENVETWDGPVDRSDFMPTCLGDVVELEAKFDALMASITNSDLSLLLKAIFSDPDVRQRYCEAPAGKAMHGAYLHGLLEHVVRQAELAETACCCYPRADRDLVITGVLLHDIGKIDEYSWDLVIDITPRGRLLGHAVIGDLLVYERGREVGISEETATRLRHLILSHHGTREFGAVVLPHTLEAVILHSVDNLEAKATHCIDMLRTGDAASPWSEYDRTEGHVWYRGLAEAAPE